MNKTKITMFCVFLILLFTGCAPKVKVALDYNPATVLELNGKVDVSNFTYIPKDGVAQNQIPNTAMGDGLFLDDEVGLFFSNAVRREFRQAGISLKANGCKLEGDVNNLLIDDLGFTVDYITDVRYILYNNDNKVLLDKTYSTKLDGLSKFVVADIIFKNLNKMFSKNIDSLMQDKDFINYLNIECKE